MGDSMMSKRGLSKGGSRKAAPAMMNERTFAGKLLSLELSREQPVWYFIQRIVLSCRIHSTGPTHRLNTCRLNEGLSRQRPAKRCSYDSQHTAGTEQICPDLHQISSSYIFGLLKCRLEKCSYSLVSSLFNGHRVP